MNLHFFLIVCIFTLCNVQQALATIEKTDPPKIWIYRQSEFRLNIKSCEYSSIGVDLVTYFGASRRVPPHILKSDLDQEVYRRVNNVLIGPNCSHLLVHHKKNDSGEGHLPEKYAEGGRRLVEEDINAPVKEYCDGREDKPRRSANNVKFGRFTYMAISKIGDLCTSGQMFNCDYFRQSFFFIWRLNSKE